MGPGDLADVVRIAAAVHPPALAEAPAVFAERRDLYPAGTFLLEVGGRPTGYVLAHPWRAGTIPPLDTLLGALPSAADCLYLHDLALLPAARGLGAAGAIVTRLAAATTHPRLALVAVGGSAPFWRRQGFLPVVSATLGAKLEGYGPNACYMERTAVGSA
ncbi:MAG: hypothetical protein BGO51_19330 [Rhodospirillales bacterium 69-11]|nr:GNAT family N-acetyltransferase [Rhodospirillales bacterium]OJW28630.1 MAG: hypothetical protein BGO51_19330 [Rhodospirillales bacterium 69-11]